MENPTVMNPSSGTAAPSKARLPPALKHLFKFLLGAAAIWALIRSGSLDPRLVGQALVRNPALCGLAFLTFAVLIIIPGWTRWFLLLRLAGLKVGAARIFSLHMIGVFFNGLIPGGTGGDLVKGYYLYKEHGQGDRALALTSMAMDRFLGLYGLLAMGLAMSWVNQSAWRDIQILRLNSLFYAGVFAGFTAAIVFFFSPYSRYFLEHPKLHRLPGGRLLKSLSDSLLVYRKRPVDLIVPMILTLLVDVGLIFIYYLFALSLEMDLPLLKHGFVVPTLTMINGIPISPAGLGVGEAAGEYIYKLMGMANGGGEVLALVHICVLSFSLAGMPFYFLFRAREPSDPD